LNKTRNKKHKLQCSAYAPTHSQNSDQTLFGRSGQAWLQQPACDTAGEALDLRRSFARLLWTPPLPCCSAKGVKYGLQLPAKPATKQVKKPQAAISAFQEGSDDEDTIGKQIARQQAKISTDVKVL
jgi:hypothetical protein